MFEKFLCKVNIKNFFVLMLVFASVFLFLKVSPAFAADGEFWAEGDQAAFQEIVGVEDVSLTSIIARIINIALGFLGILVVMIIMYAGFLWMTAGGDPDKVSKAKKWLTNGIIGLVIIASSWAIASFVTRSVGDATETSGGGYSGGSVYGGSWSNLNGGALGKTIQTHYPDRDAQAVPRNISIFVSFYEAVDINSVQLADGNVNVDVIKIYPSFDDADFEMGSEFSLNAKVDISEDNKTLRFSPTEYLGSATETVDYVVSLGNGIKKLNGDSLFENGSYYFWYFTTDTVVDTTPPKILSVSPEDPSAGCLGGCQARNKIIQIKFNEAVDPLTVSGKTISGFTNILVGEGLDVEGTWMSTNNYKMAVFIPDSQCEGIDTNSCGDPVFCLPANSSFNNTIRAANLEIEGESQARFPYDGVVDLASNSLDGNNNDLAEGRDSDDFTWLFTTNDEMRVVPPRAQSMSPGIDSEGVAADGPVAVTFTSTLLSSSIGKSIQLYEASYNSLGKVENDFLWNGPQRISLDDSDSSILVWEHFSDLNVALEGETSFIYVPRILSKIKDDYQNCFMPAGGPGCTTSDWVNGPWNEGTDNGVFPVCNMEQD
ncbi:MAG: hypothetical protein GQ527_02320 [Bacteroidales bacterium]|nr:hypothetical protein [Bacteroidales bacterium]